MKWKKIKKTENKGVIRVTDIVNEHGSIFRPVHGESDVGIDGFIELIENEESTGKLIALQIKSGESYVANSGKYFSVSVDQKHLDYWESYTVPVILVCYSPERNLLCWEFVNNYIRREKYYNREVIKNIKIEFNKKFDIEAISNDLTGVVNVWKDRAILIDCIDNCLKGNEQEKVSALSILRAHPDSRDSRMIAFLARRMICDDNDLVAKVAIDILGFHSGRQRWSWNPNNMKERDIIDYASELSMDLTQEECLRLLYLVKDEEFHGPNALGERVFDIISIVPDIALFLDNIASDSSILMQTRMAALYFSYGCDETELLNDKELLNDSKFSDVYLAIKLVVESWE